MWFDQGKLNEVKDEVLPEMAWLDIDTWIEQAEFDVRTGPRVCPHCKDTFLTVVEDPTAATQLDVCAQCDGAWLPAGQFLNLINSVLDEANKKSVPEYIKLSLQQAGETLTSSKSLATDWQNLKTVLQLLKHRIFIQHPKVKSLIVGLQKSLPL
jgi:Zn-finger nucleic acid-binding protein